MIEEKKVVGYVRSLRDLGDDCDIQTMLINRYAQIIGLDNPVMYVDKGFVPKRSLKDIERSQRLGITHLYARYYQAWEEMLLEAMNDRIGIIIVDRMERLYGNTEDKTVLEKIAQEHSIRILEVENLDWSEESHISKVWAYHYYAPKRYADRRTAALLNEIGTFYETVASHPGWRFCGLYMDSRIDRRTEFTKLWRRKDIDVVVCKSLYHINRKPLIFLSLVNEMNARGITLLSTEEGVVHYDPSGDSFLKKKLLAVSYNCCRSEHEKKYHSIDSRKLDLFYRTIAYRWEEFARYEEDSAGPGDEFEKLADNAKNYQVIVVDSVTKLGRNVNELITSIKKVGLPIYSLQEGLLYIDGEERIIQSNTVQPGIDST